MRLLFKSLFLLCFSVSPLFPEEGKFTKEEIDALFEHVLNDPENGSYLFSLAESCRFQKNYEQALFWYKMRAEKEDVSDEVWFSKYMIGNCYEHLGKWDSALYWYLEAFQTDPTRPESLYRVAKVYREEGENELAYLFAQYGTKIPYSEPPEFTNSPTYEDYFFDLELSITGYYTNHHDIGLLAANDVVLTRDVPWFLKMQTYRNILFYVEPIESERIEEISFDFPYVSPFYDERYHPMNPSLYKTETGYRMICRTVNYTTEGAKNFYTNDPEGIFRTRNFLIDFDKDFIPLSKKEIIEDLDREKVYSCIVEGLEDCRIFPFDGADWFACITADTNPTGQRQISLCRIEEKSLEDVHLDLLLPLLGPDPHRCEKNWLPFVRKGEIFLIYSFDPFTLFKPDLKTGECAVDLTYKPAKDFSSFRGSAAPIPFDDGYLVLVHEVVVMMDFTRCYLHRFLFLDELFIIRKISDPFIFQHQGVEYCCSMEIDHEEEHLIVPIGINDHEAYLHFLDLAIVRNLLKPLTKYFDETD